MKQLLQSTGNYLFAAVLLSLFGATALQAQTFPTPTGFVLPNGKTIVITYEVDVNANACATGTLPTANLSNQSNVSGSNFATVQTDDPDIAGASNPTLTPFSTLTIGDLVYKDINRDGDFDSGTDLGINGVLVRLYLDNGDGILTAADGAALTTATTAGGGLYSFTVCPGNYLVEVAASNFNPGGPLYDNGLMTALISSPIGGATDPDDDVNNDDNGDPVAGFGVAASAVTVAYGAEPVNDGDASNNSNLSVDFGFKTPTSVTINDVTMAEGSGGGTTAFTFTVTRNDAAEAFNLTYNTNDGTAVSSPDYTGISNGTVTFTAGGSLTFPITVLVNKDDIVEANETFIVLLTGNPAGVILADNSGLGTITNDDASVLTLSGGVAQAEGSSFVFTATLSNGVQGGFSVPYTTNNGTTTAADYVDNDGTLTFSGNAGEVQTITVATVPDNLVELDETFTVALGAIAGPAGVTTAGSPQTGTITNDDAATVSLAGNVTQAENLTPQVFTVNLSNPVDVAVTVVFSTSNGTATTADNDYTGIAGQTVTFAANTTTAQTVNVTIVNDVKVETDEVYNVALGILNATGRNVTLGTSAGTGTITNDDAATVTLSGGGAANEGNSGTTSRVFTATLNNPVQGGFTVAYATNDGTATTADNDYVDNDGPALIFAGTAGEVKTLTVQVNGDFKVEANETFTVTLGAIAGAPAGLTTTGSPQTATITNDELDWGDGPDTLPTLSFYNGARHATVLGFQLGAAIDGDPDGQGTGGSHSNLANGDDTDADGDDEDGVTLPGVFVAGTMATVTVNASQAGKLDAWMDFNWNRNLGDAGEKIFNNVSLVAGDNVLTFSVPPGAVVGSSFLRFRFSSAGGLSNSGLAADGEVEDYRTNIVSNQFSIDNPSVLEGNAGTSNLVFTVTRTTNNTASSVDYAITGGTATSGSDYTPLIAGTLNFSAGGAFTQTVTVVVNGDLSVENNETVIITLSNPMNGGIGTSPGTGTITNDDNASLTLSGGIAQNEGNAGTTAYTFTVVLSPDVQGGFTVPYTTNDGTAFASDNDYIDNDGTLTFAGTAGETHTITVLVNGDTKVELNETFTVALGALIGAPPAVTTAGSPQTGTITNDDAAIINIAANVSSSEAITPQSFSVTLSNPVDVPVTVQFNTADGTATTADNDYTGIVNQTVTFAANTTTAQSVNVVIVNDAKVEANETYTGTISGLAASGRNVSLGTATRTGTITNDDASTLSIAGPVTHDEGNAGTTNYVFSITMTAPVQGGFTVNYTTNDGTATTANLDYADNDGSLTFTGTNFNETKTVTVQVIGDLNIENNEVFTLLLGAISAGTPVQTAAISITGNNPETGTIVNDELDWGDAPTAVQSGFAGTYPTLAANNGARHAELPGGLKLGATVDADLDGQPNVTATGDGADEDGVTLPSAIVINTSANITVNASASGNLNAWIDYNRDGDWSDAGEQIFTNTSVVSGNNALSFAVPGGASLGTSFARFRVSTASGTSFNGLAADGEVEDYMVSIVDNQFTINDPSVLEGNAGTSSLTFTVSRTSNAAASSVDYAITGGTATSGSDYAPLASGTLSFTNGGALTQTVTVTVNGDLVVEDNETVIITLSNPVNGGISDNTGIGTITNDDAATLTLSGGISQNETNAGTVPHTFTATLSAAVQGGFTVAYTTNDGTAIAPGDYTDNDGTLTFTGTAGETKTIMVQANGDITVELNESFTENLGAIGATTAIQAAAITKVGTPQTATIVNDDAATVSLAANVSQAENLTPQVFTVNLSNPVDVPVTVLFNTSDGTATTADNDYNGIAGQTVTFAAGSTTAQTVNVTINNDSKVEADEVYNVAIGSLTAGGRNVSLGTSSRTGTITNDDNATVVLSGNVVHPEGNTGFTNYVFTVSVNNPVQGGFTVNYTTSTSSATVGSDFVDNDGALVFTGAAGETQTITVQGIGDFIVENNESFRVNLTTIVGAPIPGALNFGNAQSFGDLLNDEVDYGDAPDSYQTLNASDGARHNAFPTLFLGGATDGDADGQPGILANGDDTDAEGDDEDGVTLPNPLVTNTTASVTVNASAAGKIDGWVDFNNNGNFSDAGEKVFNNVAVTAGNNNLSFAVPNGATPSNTYARFRISSVGGLAPTGLAADGEVEDYAVQIVNTQFSINDPSVTEGNAGTSNLVFTVTRSNNASACSVNYAITGGTATVADLDYQALAAGTLTFTAGGALTATITVVVNGDVKVELNETVDITLSAPVNASILDGSGTGTIVNDDAAVITINNQTVTEGDVSTTTSITFTITMSNPSDANVVVNYNTVDGTATVANNDYVNASGTLTFTPGQVSKTVVVTINGDCAIEPNENFLLRLSALVNNGRNITLSGGGATLDGTGTITNDDALPVIACPANFFKNVDQGVCTTSVTMPLPTTSSICGTAVLEFRYRTMDAFNVPTGPFTAYALSSNNIVVMTRGFYEVEWRVTDGSGSSSCSFFLKVVDAQAPVITCPANQNITANGSCSGTVGAWSPTSLSDNCTATGLILVTQTPPSGTVLSGHNASQLITLTANDGNGNTSTCSFTVTLKDVTPPVALCKNATVNLGANGSVTVPTSAVNNGSSDNCAFTLMLTPNTFSCINLGMNNVTLKATDAGGNTATCTAKVTVQDLTAPSAQCKNPTIFLDNNGHATLTVAQVNNGSSDACGIMTMSINQTEFNCSELSGPTWPVTLTLKDVNGNTSTCLSQVTVKDAIAPTAECEDVTVQLASNGKVTVYGANLADNSTDNCSVWSYSPIAKVYTTANLGNNNLTITVKDFSNNASTCVSVVTVLPFNNIDNFQSGGNNEREAFEFVLYPNPTAGDAMVAFELPAEQAFLLRVFDMSGRLVYSHEGNGAEGENTQPVNLNGIAAGLYIVDFQSDGLKAQKRLIIQE